MRLAIGRLFLTFEPRLKSHYQNYAATGASAPTPGGGGYHGGGKASAYLCRNCYHLFGVDLIADERREFKVIEVNIEPDLTLSAGNEGASMPCPPICGSNPGRATSRLGRSLLLTRAFGPHVGTDDDTKRAVAWNAMQVVFARPSAAATLHQLLSAARPELSTILRGAAEMGDAVLYLLGAVREGKALGCFLPVYPSPAGHRALGAHLLDMSQEASRFDHKARLRLHAAFDAVLGSASAAWRQPYQVRCAASMRDVAQKQPDVPFDNAWARRKSILHDLPPVED